MSVRIGGIISKDCALKLLEEFKNEYNLGLFEICNKHVKNQLLEDEMFLQ